MVGAALTHHVAHRASSDSGTASVEVDDPRSRTSSFVLLFDAEEVGRDDSSSPVEVIARQAFHLRGVREAEPRKEIGDDVVLRGGRVLADEPRAPERARLLRHVREHGLLHAAVRRAAAEDEAVDDPVLPFRREDADRDEPHVAVAIRHAQPVHAMALLLHRLELGLRGAPRRRVELVRLVDELRDALGGEPVQAPDVDLHLERGEELVERAGLRLGLASLDLRSYDFARMRSSDVTRARRRHRARRARAL